MHVLYNVNSNAVLYIVDCIQLQDDYFIIDKGKIKIRFPCKDVRSAVVSKDNIIFKEKTPLLYDEEQGLVYPDPFYVEEEIPNDGSDDNHSEERPLSVVEMRTKIKELEKQLADMQSLLDLVMQSKSDGNPL